MTSSHLSSLQIPPSSPSSSWNWVESGKDLQKKPVQEEKKDANFEASKLTWLMATNFETQLQVLKIQIVEATT
ncbi:hypothetical protein YC2023_040893 [Brassica napus]